MLGSPTESRGEIGKKNMGSKSKTQQLPFESNKQYGWMTPPDTADITAYRGWNPQTDPTIPYQFGMRRQQLERSMSNPLGSYTTPEMREAQQRAGMESLGQEESQARRAAQFDLNTLEGQKRANLAQMTGPQLVNTKDSGYQSQVKQGSGFWGSLLSGGASAAMKFI